MDEGVKWKVRMCLLYVRRVLEVVPGLRSRNWHSFDFVRQLPDTRPRPKRGYSWRLWSKGHHCAVEPAAEHHGDQRGQKVDFYDLFCGTDRYARRFELLLLVKPANFLRLVLCQRLLLLGPVRVHAAVFLALLPYLALAPFILGIKLLLVLAAQLLLLLLD
jgi:hypothetical protein